MIERLGTAFLLFFLCLFFAWVGWFLYLLFSLIAVSFLEIAKEYSGRKRG